jgi:hypothetical protein
MSDSTKGNLKALRDTLLNIAEELILEVALEEKGGNIHITAPKALAGVMDIFESELTLLRDSMRPGFKMPSSNMTSEKIH